MYLSSLIVLESLILTSAKFLLLQVVISYGKYQYFTNTLTVGISDLQPIIEA